MYEIVRIQYIIHMSKIKQVKVRWQQNKHSKVGAAVIKEARLKA